MRRQAGAAIAVIVVTLLCASNAGAATEVGNDCVAESSAKNLTLVALSRPGNPFPLAVPRAGVVTRWKLQAEPAGDLLPQRLLVLRAAGKGSDFLAVDESETELVEAGVNEFATRIPVRAGDRFGLSGFGETYFCGAGTGLSGLYRGEVSLGETRHFELSEGIGAPVRAIFEPDRDRDGYGDERQDKCPESAGFHRNACSPVKLSIDVKARRRSILVQVRADMDVSVQVFGQVGWGFKSKRKSKDGRSKPTRLIVGLRGSTKGVAPGKAVSFRIALPKSVMRRLSRITPRESLKAEITALATDAEDALAARRVTVRLKGREGAGP
jgi:hypothetical protein